MGVVERDTSERAGEAIEYPEGPSQSTIRRRTGLSIVIEPPLPPIIIGLPQLRCSRRPIGVPQVPLSWHSIIRLYYRNAPSTMSGANEMVSIIGTVGSDIYLPASSRTIIAYDDREITASLLGRFFHHAMIFLSLSGPRCLNVTWYSS